MWRLMLVIFGISSCLSVEIEEDLGASVTRGRGFPEARSLVDQTDMLTRRTLGHHYGGGTSCLVKGSYCR